MFNSNGQDDDILRQMRNLYIRSNKLLRTFHYCSSDVKLELFKSYCTSFYCCYLCDAAAVRCTLTLELITLKH